MTRRPLLAAATLAALLASAAPAPADDGPRERSRAAFRRGVTEAAQGDYTAARDAFLEAYRLFAHPSILLNLAIARAHTGEWLEAEQDLVRFLADDGGAQLDELASARAELGVARGHLGTFRLRVAPQGAQATLDAHPVAVIAGSFVDVRTTRGTHDLHVVAEGFAPADRVVEVSSASGPDIDVRLRPGDAPGEGAGLDGRAAGGWLLLGGGALALGVGIYAGVQAQNLASEYNTAGNAHFQDATTKSNGISFRTGADVAFVGAAALGVVGVYLLLTPSTPSRRGVGLAVGPWSGLTGRF